MFIYCFPELRKKKNKAIQSKNHSEIAGAAVKLGEYYNGNGKFDKALPEFKEAAKIFKDLGKNLQMATAQRMVGEMYMLMDQFDQALKYVNAYLSKYQ